MRPRVPRMTQSALVLLSTAQRLQLGPCTPLGLGGKAQLMRWARSLQVVTCSGRNVLQALYYRHCTTGTGWHWPVDRVMGVVPCTDVPYGGWLLLILCGAGAAQKRGNATFD
jgi:hypothetical protein